MAVDEAAAYSARSASTGLIRIARRAGTAHAAAITVAISGQVDTPILDGVLAKKPHLAGVTGLKTPVVQPEADAVPLVRQGVVGCSTASGCTLILIRPTDVSEPPPGR